MYLKHRDSWWTNAKDLNLLLHTSDVIGNSFKCFGIADVTTPPTLDESAGGFGAVGKGQSREDRVDGSFDGSIDERKRPKRQVPVRRLTKIQISKQIQIEDVRDRRLQLPAGSRPDCNWPAVRESKD